MSGEPPVALTADADSVLARAVGALGRFPADPPWVLVGGLAVFVRLGSITRPTTDADTVARSQAELLRRLVEAEPTSVVAGGEIVMTAGGGSVEIDVMDLADDPLPGDIERRAFALARRVALATATAERVIVTDHDGFVVADETIPIATIPALVALKAVAMVRRPHGNHPEKVGSDIHDLVRLVTAAGARAVAADLATADAYLAGWVAGEVDRAFGRDLRYTLLRLRTNDRSAAAQALTDADVAAAAVLADAIRDEVAE